MLLLVLSLEVSRPSWRWLAGRSRLDAQRMVPSGQEAGRLAVLGVRQRVPGLVAGTWRGGSGSHSGPHHAVAVRFRRANRVSSLAARTSASRLPMTGGLRTRTRDFRSSDFRGHMHGVLRSTVSSDARCPPGRGLSSCVSGMLSHIIKYTGSVFLGTGQLPDFVTALVARSHRAWRATATATGVDGAICFRRIVGCEDVKEGASHPPQGPDEGMTVAATEVIQPRVVIADRRHHLLEDGARLGASEQRVPSLRVLHQPPVKSNDDPSDTHMAYVMRGPWSEFDTYLYFSASVRALCFFLKDMLLCWFPFLYARQLRLKQYFIISHLYVWQISVVTSTASSEGHRSPPLFTRSVNVAKAFLSPGPALSSCSSSASRQIFSS